MYGLNSHIASRYPEFGTLAAPADLVRQLGVGWVREDVQWSRVEPSRGDYDWAWHDTVFQAHQRNGINIIGVIGPAVGWATPEPGDAEHGVSFYPPDPDQYAVFAASVAVRYRGLVKAWEIWNEPENPALWQPAPDPALYARFLIKASAAIRAVDPGVTILSGGVVPFNLDFLNRVAAEGAWDAFDAISVHPYVDPYTPEGGQIEMAGMENVARLAERYGRKPIWVTEYGWSTGPCERDPQGLTDEEEQADFLVRGAVLLRGAGAERVLWYNFKDHPQQPCYGVVRGGDREDDYRFLKPSATALRVLSEQVGAAKPLGSHDIMPREVVLPFEDASGWGQPFPADATTLRLSSTQVHSGTTAAEIAYQFNSLENDYVAYPRTVTTPLPDGTTRIGLWVYGDGSGNLVQVRIADADGEVLQFRLGFLGSPGWQFLSATITGQAEEGNRIAPGNGRLDGPLRLHELIVDDYENGVVAAGTIFVDDLTAFVGVEVFNQRFQNGSDTIDVLWASGERQVDLVVDAPEVTVTDRDGATRMLNSEGGSVTLGVGPSPVYVRQTLSTSEQ